jgi:alginate O-acetyltransferase complex protein AlgI
MQITASLLDFKFILLLLGLSLLRPLWPRSQYALLLALGSALIVGLAAPRTLAVISAITLLYLYPLHRIMRAAVARGRSESVSRLWLPLGMGGLVAALVVFKCYRHFTVPWLDVPRLGPEALALIGFSYFILRAMGFLHIQTILNVDQHSPWELLGFTLFPPTLTSGPIQKFQDFHQQVLNPEPLSRPLVFTAVYRITRGYFRKTILALLLNKAVETLLAVHQPSVYLSALTVATLYLYFYFDFAGYSDIAIGFGLLLGIRVPENFRKPFLATTASEFWRNWHITLVDWFRDQVFIPLGGMGKSRFWAASLAFFIMVLCGLWHGLTFSFLAWGTWHGLILFTEAISGAKPVPPPLRRGIKYWARVLWTNARIAFGGLFFLPPDTTLRLLGGLAKWRVNY